MVLRIKALVAGGLLAIAVFGVAIAGPLEDGYAAYKLGDYAAAMSYWRPLADQGNAWAQDNLGVMYLDGQGVAQDYAQALVWFRSSDQPFTRGVVLRCAINCKT
jgi:TPR repeat protein